MIKVLIHGQPSNFEFKDIEDFIDNFLEVFKRTSESSSDGNFIELAKWGNDKTELDISENLRNFGFTEFTIYLETHLPVCNYNGFVFQCVATKIY